MIAKEHPHIEPFQLNGFYERLAEMRKSDPRGFASISPASKLALYAYETAKREAQRLEAITDEPEAA